MSTESRKQYTGATRALVVAIDVGTTFSGVSYAILEPGEVPKIHGVTRFPGQEHVAGNSKIPSILYYDANGKLIAAGAEADTASIHAQAEDEGWIKTELFKLRLRPRTMKLQMNGMRLGPLPRGKTAVDVFGDFLGYLYQCTRNFIIDTHANGRALWKAVETEIQFVLSHPNGWEGAQQTKMRRAAEHGGLVPSTNEGRARIRFVTEGEASLHACVLNGLAADVLSNSSKPGFLIVDAGGGTLDISAYQIKQTSPLIMEEVAPPDCIFAGSVFVDRRAREFLAEKLKNSKYGTADAVEHIAKRFSETTKRLFRDRKDLQFIPFGSPLDKDISVGIRGGQLKLTGDEVSELFEPSIEAAVIAIRAQIAASAGIIKSVWLVGGFAASPWLFTQLQERLAALNVVVSRPDSQTSKAVADGAIGFWCDHHVHARMSKFYYGVEFLRDFDPSNEEHVARKDRLCELPSGPKLLPDAFDCILARGVKVKESTVFTRKYSTELTSLAMLSVFEVEIWCYRGQSGVPPWILRDREDFSTLCVVRANLANLAPSAQPKEGKNGKIYWTIIFSVEIHFGLTEFKARIKWVDSNGKIKYGPASIIYNESGHRADEDEADSMDEDQVALERQTNRSVSKPVSRAHSRDSYHSFSLGESPVPPPSIPEPSHASTPPPAPPSEVPDVQRVDTRSATVSTARTPSMSARSTMDDGASERSSRHSEAFIPDDHKGLSTPQLGAQLTEVWGTAASSPMEPPPSEPPQSVAQTPLTKSPSISTKTPAAARSPTLSRSTSVSKSTVTTTTSRVQSTVVSRSTSKVGTPLKTSTPIPPESVGSPLPQVPEEQPPPTPKVASSKAPSVAPSKVNTPAKSTVSIPPSPRESLAQVPEEAVKTPTAPPSKAPSMAGSNMGTPANASMSLPGGFPSESAPPSEAAQSLWPVEPTPIAQTPMSLKKSEIGTPTLSRAPSVPNTPKSVLSQVAASNPGTPKPATPSNLGTPKVPSSKLATPTATPKPPSSKLATPDVSKEELPPSTPAPAATPALSTREVNGADVPSSTRSQSKPLPPPSEPKTPAAPSRPVSVAGSVRGEQTGGTSRPASVVGSVRGDQGGGASRPASVAGSVKGDRTSQFIEPMPEQSETGAGLWGNALNSLSNRASSFGFGTASARQSLFGSAGGGWGGWGGGGGGEEAPEAAKRKSGISAAGWGSPARSQAGGELQPSVVASPAPSTTPQLNGSIPEHVQSTPVPSSPKPTIAGTPPPAAPSEPQETAPPPAQGTPKVEGAPIEQTTEPPSEPVPPTPATEELPATPATEKQEDEGWGAAKKGTKGKKKKGKK